MESKKANVIFIVSLIVVLTAISSVLSMLNVDTTVRYVITIVVSVLIVSFAIKWLKRSDNK